MNQSFEAPARRKSWVLDSEGSWAEGWVWLSVGKAQSDPVTAGWGLGVPVPRSHSLWCGAGPAGSPGSSFPALSILPACAGS